MVYLLARSMVMVVLYASGTGVVCGSDSEAPASIPAQQRDRLRSQVPALPLPYESREVKFDGAEAGVRLAGTLTVPESAKNVPGILLIQGSGRADRNETHSGGHKPALVLADALTRSGYVVLRYDKRGVGDSTGDGRSATVPQLADDARAAFVFLKRQPGVHARRTVVIGHSEGGMIALLMGADAEPPAAVVSLMGPVAPMTEQLPLQEVLAGSELGANAEYAAKLREYYSQVVSVMRTMEKEEKSSHIAKISDEWRKEFPENHPNHPAAADSFLGQPRWLASDWLRSLLLIDVQPAIANAKSPTLIVYGSSDRQVTALQNLISARSAIGEETQLRKVVVLPQINHMYQESVAGRTDEYAEIEQTLSPLIVQTVLDYLDSALASHPEYLD